MAKHRYSSLLFASETKTVSLSKSKFSTETQSHAVILHFHGILPEKLTTSTELAGVLHSRRHRTVGYGAGERKKMHLSLPLWTGGSRNKFISLIVESFTPILYYTFKICPASPEWGCVLKSPMRQVESCLLGLLVWHLPMPDVPWTLQVPVADFSWHLGWESWRKVPWLNN